MNKLVISFYGSPNSGKTVAASSMFALLKKEHVDVGLVTEYARQAVVEQNTLAISDQLFIWANQNHHIYCAYQHYQVVVTDSPILLGTIYNEDDSGHLKQVIINEYHKYNNFNILLTLNTSHPYSMAGRVHSYTESMSIQNQLVELLDNEEIPYLCYDDTTEDDIVQLVLEAIK
jgi:hypothetical protein